MSKIVPVKEFRSHLAELLDAVAGLEVPEGLDDGISEQEVQRLEGVPGRP